LEFHDFPTVYGMLKRNGLVEDSPNRFYAEALALLRSKALHVSNHVLAVENNRTVCEWDWIKLGSPYFKVWPSMIPLLSNVNIEVPVDYLRLPFKAFVIRLPSEDNPLAIDEQYFVRAILVSEGQPQGEDSRRVFLWIDVGERGLEDSPVLTYCQLDCVPGIQIEEAFYRLPMEEDIPGVHVPRELQERCLRLIVSVCFLATGEDRLVEPDVLSKDLAAYIEAQKRGDQQRIDQMSARAVRRGKKGWHVGQQERFRPLGSPATSHDDHEGNRGPLSHQHQRRAHFRLLPTQTRLSRNGVDTKKLFGYQGGHENRRHPFTDSRTCR
jgi:hypothetical protein